MWLENHSGLTLVVLEIGCGDAIPKLRNISERVVSNSNRAMVRINPEKAQLENPGIIHLRLGAEDALTKLLR